MLIQIDPSDLLRGRVRAPGDKSLSHRALLFAALSSGACRVEHLAPGADVRSTAACLEALGVPIARFDGGALVTGVGLQGLKRPASVLDCGNSGTTMRLLAGVIAGSGVPATLDGDESLRGRPMKRVLQPLRDMGARARGTVDAKGDEKAPLVFEAGALQGCAHVLPVASAQVKSALLLAGLWAEGETSVREPHPSRDHTERMFQAMGAPLERHPDGTLRIRRPDRPLRMPARLEVPGDPSSAAFLVGAAVLAAHGELEVEGVNTNPTRLGFLRVLERMGADVALVQPAEQAGEPVATIRARGGRALRATDIAPDEVPSLLDEVPLLAVVATQAHGTTTIRGAGELRVKESDRLAQVAQHLLAMGARVQELPDGLIIEGPTRLRGVRVDAARDHRIAMAFAIAGRVAEGPTTIDGAEWADISFPGFYGLLAGLR